MAPSLMLGMKAVTWSRVRLATLVSIDKHNIDAGTHKASIGRSPFSAFGLCKKKQREMAIENPRQINFYRERVWFRLGF